MNRHCFDMFARRAGLGFASLTWLERMAGASCDVLFSLILLTMQFAHMKCHVCKLKISK